MSRRHTRALAGAAGVAVALAMAPVGAMADSGGAPAVGPEKGAQSQRQDDKPNPLGDAERALRKEAVSKLIRGEATLETRGGQRVIKVKGNPRAAKGSPAHRDKYVSYPVEREEAIFTILSEFGDQTMYGGEAGPLRNKIPAPDKATDNSTYWLPDFNRQHYLDMMFGKTHSFKDFYLKQSNGRFLAKGDVSDWVKVPYNEARYGNNAHEADGYWNYVKDTATAWYNAQKAAGKSDADIAAYLKQFDHVDRYDYDGDGNFNEPDGYVDHFQAIHAGMGEEAGGGAQGADAIWSHRWYAFATDIGKTGPAYNKAGGVQLGTSGMWIGDYTTEPENGGLGVFTHEFGHDLGLRDYYDTAGGDNGTGFWTLMSAGSWLSQRGENTIGTTPGYMGPHEKLLLGWLDYKIAPYGVDDTYWTGPADRDSKTLPQAVIVPLPDKKVTVDYNTPHSGQYEWWGGKADNLNTTLTRTVDLTGKTSASMSYWSWYKIEADYDYTYVETSVDGGATWTRLAAHTGDAPTWTQHTVDLSAFAGKQVQVRFHSVSDGGMNHDGFFVDDIAVTADGATVFSDDVEGGTNGWTAKGYTRMTGSTSDAYANYYIAENRVYAGYDATLRTGPYNFGWSYTKPNWVEKFPFQNGLLVWYVDDSYVDNNTKTHPGGGFALPIDARPRPVMFSWVSGGTVKNSLLGNRRQSYDATFGQERTDPVTFHKQVMDNGKVVTLETRIPSQPAIPTFDDTNPNRYWSAANPWNSVKVAGSGLSITVGRTTGDNMMLKVRFAN